MVDIILGYAIGCLIIIAVAFVMVCINAKRMSKWVADMEIEERIKRIELQRDEAIRRVEWLLKLY